MSHYKHLTLIERERIMFFRAKGYSITKIAENLRKNKSTISRELKRNSTCDEYIPAHAQSNYRERRKACKPKMKLHDKTLFKTVKRLFLEEQWSPEQIANRLSVEHGEKVVSYQTIYRAIYAGHFNEKGLSSGNKGAVRKLRHRGKTRHTSKHVERRGKIRISNPIENRPKEANTRQRIGDWEADTVLGPPNTAAFVTLDDRMSRYRIVSKIEKKNSINVAEAIVESLRYEPLHSITPDRGKEFSKHFEVTETLGVEFYFPLPSQPWKRGTNENANGLIREYFPKGMDLSGITNEYLQYIVDKINKRPRKCLGWKTPYEVYHNKTLHLV